MAPGQADEVPPDSPAPTSKSRIKIAVIHRFFFPLFPSFSSRQALAFPLAAGNSDNTIPWSGCVEQRWIVRSCFVMEAGRT